MTGLSADKEVNRKAGNVVAYPVAAETTIYKGAGVCDNGDGYAVPAADTSGYIPLGIAVEKVDNSEGEVGDKWIRVYKAGTVEAIHSGAAQTDIGTLFYWLDDQTVDENAGVTNSVKAGYCVEVPDSDTVRLRIDNVVQ
ncbi:unnamed protein product [marine sediment metagenome]|uniref:Uncharacterized protein n=1 Tax=marine sediment metagenome TaxID=412755 RepID=X1EZI4_9ZZZZ